MKQSRVFIFITSLLLIGSLNAADPALSLTELLKTAGERNPDVLSAYQKMESRGQQRRRRERVAQPAFILYR
jgi:hypothetical protein